MYFKLRLFASFRVHATSKSNDTTKLTLPLIERVVNAFKTHHAALDFDAGFVNGFMPATIDGVIL